MPGMETLAVRPEIDFDAEFHRIWEASRMEEHTPAIQAGMEALEKQYADPEAEVTTVHLTDVTLRDGQQQRTAEVTTEQRVAVFDRIVETGVDRIEIGHLGNKKADQQLAREIVKRVAEREPSDERYANVKLQVLFGSQEDLIQDGVDVLREAFQDHYGEDWQTAMADKVVVHVYDRIDEQLTNTSRNPYTPEQSAGRISKAAQYAVDAGFKHFSTSAEAATAVRPEQAIQFYRAINQYLFAAGAETVNVNLANTYGFSANRWWNADTMTIFNTAVKDGFPEGAVSTSIHTHNDVDNAVGFAVSAMVAGFDRVEGTINGMGERQGNVANIDVVGRVLEAARQEHEQSLIGTQSVISHMAGRHTLSRRVRLDDRVINNFDSWYQASKAVSEVFGPHATYRFYRTAVGNPYAHDNGSGPHDQAMKAGVMDPVNNPPYRNYEWGLTTNDILGRPQTDKLAIGDPEAVRDVTVGNHAGGGSTDALLEGTAQRATPEVVAAAEAQYAEYKRRLIGRLGHGAVGVMMVAG